MIRPGPAPALLLPLVLCACGNFPSVDAAQPKDIGARPPYMSQAEREQLERFLASTPAPISDDLGQDLRARAEALRSR